MNEDEINNKPNQQEDDGWDKAVKDFADDKGVKQDESVDDKNKKLNENQASEEEQETEEQRVEREKKEADESAAKSQREAEEASRIRARELRESRTYQRDILAEETAMRNDVRESLFKNKDYSIKDGQGNVISSIEDLMQYTNPQTGQLFTEDEAGARFLKWSQEKEQERQNDDKRVNDIAEYGLRVKDEADTVFDKYGEYLNRPENAVLKQRLIDEYMATLQVEGNVIVGVPMSMVKFYDIALENRLAQHQNESQAQQERRAAEDRAKKEAEQAEKNKKLEAENKRLRARGDRADIYDKGGDKNDDRTDEEKGWDKAEAEFKRDKGIK